jgi:hypothetical protein
MFNSHSVKYQHVVLGSADHVKALQDGYRYSGPAHVANLTEIKALRDANAAFMATLNN